MALSAQEVKILITAQNQASAALKAVEGDLGRLGNQGSSISAKLAPVGTALASIAVAGGAALAAGLTVGIKSAGDLEQAVANISTIKPDIDTSAVFASLNEMSTRIPQSAAALGDGLYDIFSSMEVTQEEALSLMETFAKGAVGSQTDAKTFGTAVMGVMNAYKLSAKDAGDVSDWFFDIVNKGVVTGPELAASLGPVIASAKAMGVEWRDLGPMIAAVTKEGGPAAQNINNLNNFLQKLSTKEAQKALGDLGIKTKTTTGDLRSPLEVLTDLKKRTEGMTEAAKANAMQEIFPDAQARIGAEVLMSQIDMVKKGTEEAQNSSGAAAAAYTKMSATFNSQSKLLVNSLTAIGTEIGGELLPMITPMIAKFAQDLPGAFRVSREAVDDLYGLMIGGGTSGAFNNVLMNLGATEDQAIATSDVIADLGDAWRTVQQAFAGDWAPDDSITPLALAAGNAALAILNLGNQIQLVNEAAGRMGAWDSFASGVETVRTEIELALARLDDISTSFGRLQSVLGGTSSTMNGASRAIQLLGAAFEVSTIGIGLFLDTSLMMIDVGINLVSALTAIARGFYALATGDIPTFLKAGDLAEESFRAIGTTITGWANNNVERAKQGYRAIAGAAETEMPAMATAVEGGMSEASQAAAAGFLEMASAADADLGVMAAAAVTRFAELSATAGTSTAEAVAAVDTGMAGMAPAVDAGMAGAVAGIQAAAPAMAAAAESGATQAVAAVEGQTGAANAAGASVGQNIGQGMMAGIGSYIGAVAAKAVEMVQTAIAAARGSEGADAHSPSKKTEKLGKDMADGLEIGLTKSGIGAAMIAQIQDFIRAAGDYVPVGREIARVEREIKDIRDRAQTEALFRQEDMITIESELLRLKRDQVDEERRLLPIREDVAAAERAIRDITNGSLGDRSALLENDTQRKQIRLQTLDLEKQLVGLDRDSKRAEGIQKQIDKLRDQDRLLGIEADRIRLTNDLAATAERRRVLGLGEILVAEERNIQAINRQIAVLGAEEAVFRANEAIIKNATENEIAYRQRLIAVFNAEGKPLQDRIVAGLALVDQLEKEDKISKELADKLRDIAKEAGFSTEATKGMGAAAATAAPQIDAAAKKAKEMADQAGRIADEAKDAGKEVNALANMLGKLPSWMTPKGSTTKSVLFGDSVATTSTTRDVASLVQPVALAGVGAAPGGVGAAGPMQRQDIVIDIGGTTLARLVATGMRLELRRVGTLPGLNGGI